MRISGARDGDKSVSTDGVGRWRRSGRAVSRGVRKVLRGFRTVWNALELVDFIIVVVRIVTAPFRLLASALNALWWCSAKRSSANDSSSRVRRSARR